jgi:drug/metabolite transporter (DMT)-like permease
VGSVILGVILLSEAPSFLQLLGVLCIFSGVVVATARRSARVTA